MSATVVGTTSAARYTTSTYSTVAEGIARAARPHREHKRLGGQRRPVRPTLV
jgi:hypothetical protein